jgi:hypothetical protein
MRIIGKRDLGKLNHKMQVCFALFCARQVEKHWKDIPECVEAIRVTELWLEGKATGEECRIAYDLVHGVAELASDDDAHVDAAINAPANAADAVGSAVLAASWDLDGDFACTSAMFAAENTIYSTIGPTNKTKAIEEQWDYYHELLNFDKNFEKVVLGS